MADGEINHAVESGSILEADRVNGFNFVSFESGKQVDYCIEYPRKRITKRPLAAVSLELASDTETRLKKRYRKGEKRFIEDKLDGYTFVSAFSLNDFDDYDKVKPKCASPAPTKRKSTAKIESVTSKKKPRKPVCTTYETLGTSVVAVEKGSCNLVSDQHPIPQKGTTSSTTKKKSLSPLTKSALVRLKKINVSSLNQNKNTAKNKQVLKDTQDCHNVPQKINQKNISRSRRKQSFNLKVPHMQIDKPRLNGIVSNHPDTNTIIVSDSDDIKELDVCSIDESASSSQFILNNLNTSEEKDLNPAPHSDCAKLNKAGKPKRKPCRTCCAHPCRIVGAKKVKSSGFPSFDVSYTTKCKVHPAGEIIVHDSSSDKVDVCIQATSTDIKMHLDFAKRFPYNAISVVSCQPSLDDEDLNPPVITEARAPVSVNELHRVTELKRREEHHGLYCKLAETLDISKERASKQWILETAMKEIKSLEAERTILTATMNLEKHENEKLRKRWEESSGTIYVPPVEGDNAAKLAGKSKLLELYVKYRQDVRKELELKKPSEKEMTGETNKEKCELDGACDTNNSVVKPSQVVTVLGRDFSLESRKNSAQVGPQATVTQPNSTNQLVTTAKHTSVGPHLIVRPFQHKPNILRRTLNIPRIDLTNQAETPLSHLLERSTTPVTTTSNLMTNPPSFKSPPFIQTSAHPGTTPLATPTQSSADLSITPLPLPTLSTTPLPPPTQSSANLSTNPLPPPTQSTTSLPPPTQSTTPLPPPTQISAHLRTTPLPPTQSGTFLKTTHVGSTSVSGVTNQNTVLPTTSGPQQVPSKSSPPVPANNEFLIVSVLVRGKTTIFRVPKTPEGLNMLSRLSVTKQLSANSIAKIAQQVSPSNQLEHLTMPTTVNTESQVTTPTTPTQWATVAMAQSPTPSDPIEQPGDASEQQKKVVFLDLTSKDKSKAEAFSVIPSSSSINLTLNKVGSITANKVFNVRPARPQSYRTIAPIESQEQILHRTVPSSILPRPTTNVPTSPTTVHVYPLPPQNHVNTSVSQRQTAYPKPGTNIPTSIPCTSVATCPPATSVPNCPPTNVTASLPATSVHTYPPPPQNPLNTSVSQLQPIIPDISDSLLESTYGLDSLDDHGMCVISNVFSLIDTAIGKTSNSFESTKVDATVEVSKTVNPDVQSPNIVEDNSGNKNCVNEKWEVEVLDSSVKHS